MDDREFAELVARFPDANPNHHRDGIPWYDAPVPRRWHRCWPQTTGSTRTIARVERCACGATRLDGPGHPWIDRNSRRKQGER